MKKVNKKFKVAVAMSGGVDSAVAAALLVQQGYDVTGIHLHLWSENCDTQNVIRKTTSQNSNVSPITYHENKCCSTESLEAARKTAFQLGIPFHVLNFEEIFRKTVVKSFLEEYGQGMTPNPCVACNKFIKFGALLDYVRAMGFEYLATGHYCRITAEIKSEKFKVKSLLEIREKIDSGQARLADAPAKRARMTEGEVFHLLQGKDKTKDQTYFLYNLTQDQLAHIMFPVGDFGKPEVRKLAEKYNLPSAKRPESQEICFFAESDYRPFLKRHLASKIKHGLVVDTQGKIIGTHQGLPLYTIGQRHGFEIKIKKLIPPFYVIAKDIFKNQLVVGFGPETEIKEFKIKNSNWLMELPQSLTLFVKIRHQGDLLPCKLTGDNVILKDAKRGVSPGQSAVFYLPLGKNYEVVGGGVISV